MDDGVPADAAATEIGVSLADLRGVRDGTLEQIAHHERVLIALKGRLAAYLGLIAACEQTDP